MKILVIFLILLFTSLSFAQTSTSDMEKAKLLVSKLPEACRTSSIVKTDDLITIYVICIGDHKYTSHTFYIKKGVLTKKIVPMK